MFLRTVELAFARFQARRDSRALAIVFDRTAPELLRVARHLASSEASAEDLVQATFLQAIEAADSHERGRPVLPWLLGVLANQARVARRRQRRELEPGRTRGDIVADAFAEVTAREFGAELQRAIDRLPEAYRPVLRLWFEHGLEAQEIARTLERPAGTVRAQISRGLDQLRRLLPAGLASAAAVTALPGRGLAAVRRAVLQQGAGTSVAVGSLAFGGLLVLHSKMLSAGVALALGLLGWSLWSGGAPAEPMPAATAEVAGAGVAVAAELPVAPAPAAAVPVAPRVDAAPVAAAAPPPAPTTTGALLVHVVAAGSGAPVAGVGVALQSAADLQSFGGTIEFVASGNDGTVRFDALEPGEWHIDVDRVGRAAMREVAAGDTVEVVVAVPAGVTVHGTVVDARGVPVPGAEVVVQASRLWAPVIAVADAQGRFEAADLATGVELQARRRGRAPSLALAIAGSPGSEIDLELRLGDAGRRLTGRALDQDGAPLEAAVIAVLPAAASQATFWDRDTPQARPLWLRTDAAGAFATDEAPAAPLLVVAQPRGAAAMPCWVEVDTTGGDAVADLRAARGGRIEGHIDAEHRGDLMVMGWPRATEPLGFLANLVAARHAQVAKDGTFALDGLLPGEVEVRAFRGMEIVANGVVTVVAGETTRWDGVATAPRPLLVRLAGTAARPAGLMIWVGPHVPDNSAPAMRPVTGDEVQFEVRREVDVDVTAVVMVGGMDLMMLARVESVPPSLDEVTLTLRDAELPARWLRGRLVDGDGAPLANTELVAQRSDGALVVRRTTHTGADGAFAIGPLPAGDYILLVGGLRSPRLAGTAVLTPDRDTEIGDLRGDK